MLYYLHNLTEFWGPFRIFEYISVRAVIAALIALLFGAFFAPKILARLRDKIQPERDEKLMGEIANKRKVPTMGGLIIAVSVAAGTLLAARPNVYVFATLVVYIGMSLVGFWDDWKKITRASSDGISEKAKWIGLTLAAALGYGVLIFKSGPRMNIFELWLPIMKRPLVAFSDAVISSNDLSLLGVFAFVAIVFFFFWVVCVGTSNAVNLTDGLDGLAAGCTIPCATVLGAVSYLAGHKMWAAYLNIGYIPGVGELLVFCVALIAGTLVFLWYNCEPAEVYMGDVGALGLGGALGAVAVLSGHPILLLISGGVFVAEAGSTIIQRVYFKITKRIFGEGRRVFTMTPIHHTWQKRGVKNPKIVVRFWMISLVFAVVALATLKLR